MPPVDIVGSVAAILTTLCWLPQVLKTIRTRDTSSISLHMQLAFLSGTALWLVYGAMIGSLPVVAANSVTFVLVSVITAMKLRHG